VYILKRLCRNRCADVGAWESVLAAKPTPFESMQVSGFVYMNRWYFGHFVGSPDVLLW
jgi:hypothetical protein